MQKKPLTRAWAPTGPPHSALRGMHCHSRQPSRSFPGKGHAHPEQEGLQVFSVSPLLKNTIQGLHVPGAALGISPGNKAFRTDGLDFTREPLAAPPPLRLQPPLDLGPLTSPAVAAHIPALRPVQDPTCPSPLDFGRDSCLPSKENKAPRSQVTHPRAQKGRKLTLITPAVRQALCSVMDWPPR